MKNDNGEFAHNTSSFEELTGPLRRAFEEIRNESVCEVALQRVLRRARSIETLGDLSQENAGFDVDYAAPRVEPCSRTPFSAESGSVNFWARVAARCPRRTAWRSLVVMVCAALLLLALFVSGPTTPNLAFAAVQERIEKTRSVTYLETRLPSAGISQETRRVMILGRYLQRDEVDERSQDGMSFPRWISISDLQKGKHVILTPSEKRFVILTSQVTLSADGAIKNEEDLKPQPEADLYQKIRDIPAAATTRLPDSTIEDKRVAGFYFEESLGSNTWKRTFWVDPATKLPVRIEVSHRSTTPGTGPSDWVQSDFQFDNDLEKSLFSTEAPEGYVVETAKIHGIENP